MKNIKILFLVLLGVFSVGAAQASSWSYTTGGTTPTATSGTTYVYTFNADSNYGDNVVWVLANSAGTSFNATHSGTTYTVTVQWTRAGSSSVSLNAFGSSKGTLNVVVSCAPGNIPSVPTNAVAPGVCGSGTAQMSATPGSGANSLTWYNSSSGGTPFLIATSYTAGVGTYYAASYNTTNGCESTSRITIQIQGGTVPPQPTVVSAGSVCPNAGPVTLQGNAVQGMVVWYANNTSGDHLSGYLATGPTYAPTISATTTFYMAAYIPGGCETPPGSRIPITATALAAPSAPATPVTTTNACGDQTVSYGDTKPQNIDWYWQGTNSSGQSTNSNPTYNATSSGTYYLRARNGVNCWSPSSGVTVTVNPYPSAPGPVNVSTETCGPKTLSYTTTPPPATGYYWQGQNAFLGDYTSFTATNSTYTASMHGTYTYYAMARTTAGCWSVPGRSVVVTVDNPATPPTPVTTNNACGWQSLNVSGTPENGVTWYWQDPGSGGHSTSNPVTPGVSYTAIGTGTYSLAAKSANCWSLSNSSVGVTVNQIPLPPGPLDVSTNLCGPKTVSYTTTPTPGTAYFWQGSCVSCQDTGLTAQAPTYVVSTPGNASVYAATRSDAGCWSSVAQRSPTVNNPAPANAQGSVPNVCEWDLPLTLSATPVGGTAKWYPQAPLSSATSTGNSYSTGLMNPGTYYYNVVNIDGAGCESTPVSYSVVVNSNCDDYLNWKESISYTYSNPANANTGSIASHSKVYNDAFGNAIQSQVRSITNNAVLASESIFDRSGNQTLSTLPAPINSSSFAYRHRFTTNSSSSLSKYSWADFDAATTTGAAGEVNNPVSVGNSGPGSLGWYYSSSNNLEPNTPTTNYPYARSYSPPGPNPKTSKSSSPGNAFRMGASHEVSSQRIQLLSADTDLDHYYTLRPFFVPTPITSGTNLASAFNVSPIVAVSPQNSSAAVYQNFVEITSTISGGFPIARFGGNINVTAGKSYLFSVRGYVPAGKPRPNLVVTTLSGASVVWVGTLMPSTKEDWISVRFTAPAGATQVQVGVMWNQDAVANDSKYYVSAVDVRESIPAQKGYKYISTDPDGKQTVSFVDADGRSIVNAVVVNGGTYDFWSYSFYNDAGQVIATVAPKDVDKTVATKPVATTFRYDHLGRAIETTTPDEGTSQSVYSTDGKIRFSQNQEQRNTFNKRFSYTNYDSLGRAIESGEYTYNTTGDFIFDPPYNSPSANSVLAITDNLLFTGVTRRGHNSTASRYSDTTFVDYDLQAADFTALGTRTKQNNVIGRVARTRNANATTWYSYDEFGRTEWTIQNITGLGKKVIDYSYDFLGNVTQVAYQNVAGSTDRFYHHYTYDADSRLIQVATSLDGSTKTVRANYYYYLHGPLKRVELMRGTGKVQGIDYVYNIDGSLKAINHSDPSRDPGNDVGGSGFPKDVFGMVLDYYSGDYSGAGLTGLGAMNATGSVDQFSGLVKSQRWHNTMDVDTARAYVYSYDNVNRFTSANWGAVSGSGGTYSFAPASNQSYKESIGSYDKNGNIQGLMRNGKGANVLGNYTYNYTPGKNQLASISGTTGVTYTYNGIGQMTQQVEGANTLKVSYNAFGLVKDVKNAGDKLLEQYFYDDRGDLVKKMVYKPDTLLKTTYYVRDASGTPLSIYEANRTAALSLYEQPIYGSGRIGTMKLKASVPKYFYEIGDHLGNVRAVIGDPVTESVTATYESSTMAADQGNFLRYKNARRVSASIFDHTNGTGSGYSERLDGSTNEKFGLARSLKVMSGDTIRMEVWAKYVDTNESNWTAALTTLIGQVRNAAAGVVFDGGSYATSTTSFPFAGLVTTTGSTGGPKAYLNWIVFDRNFVMLDGGYRRLSATPKEQGQDVAHEKLSSEIITTQPGYVYVYLSNEEASSVQVYFDDFKVTQVHSKVVAGGDYYPFGLPMDTRQADEERYRFGYQGQFAEMDSLTNWNTFQLRMYDARFGRWMSPDPYGQFDSPYVGMGNNPVSGTDPDGGFSTEPFFMLGEVVVTATAIPYPSLLSTITAVFIATGNIRTSLIAPPMPEFHDEPANLSKMEFVWEAAKFFGRRIETNALHDFKAMTTGLSGFNRTVAGPIIPKYGGDSEVAERLRADGNKAGYVFQLMTLTRSPMSGNNFSFSVSGGTSMLQLNPALQVPISTTLDEDGMVYAKKRDGQQFDDVCREAGIKDKEAFSEYLHELKATEGRGPADHYTYRELLEIARQYLLEGGY